MNHEVRGRAERVIRRQGFPPMEVQNLRSSASAGSWYSRAQDLGRSPYSEAFVNSHSEL